MQNRANSRQTAGLRQTVNSKARAAIRGVGAPFVSAASETSSAPIRRPAYDRLARFLDGVFWGDDNFAPADAVFREMFEKDLLRLALLSEKSSSSEVVATGEKYRIAAHALACILALCDGGLGLQCTVAHGFTDVVRRARRSSRALRRSWLRAQTRHAAPERVRLACHERCAQ